MTRARTVVVGAGVIGLTTAIRLAEAGHRVEIVTADEPLATTSTAATGMVGFGFAEPLDKAPGWRQATVVELEGSMGAGLGVRLQPGLLAGPEPFHAPESFRALPGYRVAQRHELPDGFAPGFWVDMIAVDLDRYLPDLVRRAERAGVTIEIGRVAVLDDLDADVVVNAAGIGALDLVDDPDLWADWGMHVIVENRGGLDHHFMEMPSGQDRWISWMPHGDRVLIGGASVPHRREPAADPAVRAELLTRLAVVNPELAAAPVIGLNAGVRPARRAVRVETEIRPTGRMVVHNYGHGGLGLTLSWGTADEVVALVGRRDP
ncbi:MAG: NAD(P)/FAD-dependent oxidoreductase [Desertimonas sp.]